MTTTNKGNYVFCDGCKYEIQKTFDASSEKYPCYYSHNAVRNNIKDDKCKLFEQKDKE